MARLWLIWILLLGLILTGCAPKDVDENAGEQPQENGLTEGVDYTRVDRPMENFQAWDFGGNDVELSDYKGKIIFLFFSATWCGPCREMMPVMQEFYEQYKDQGVVVLAVSSTIVEMRGGDDFAEAERRVEQYMVENDLTFPVLLDRHDEGWEIYKQRGIPVNYVIDKEGIVRFLRPGSYRDKQQIVEFMHAVEEAN